MADLPSGFINLDTVIDDRSPQAKEVIISYARILNRTRLTVKNAPVFVKILSTNEKRAVDELIRGKDPFLMFSSITPDRKLVISVFRILSSYRPKELYANIFHACMGLLLNAYSGSGSAINIYQPAVSDIQHTAKYLVIPDREIQERVIDLFYRLSDDKSLDTNLFTFISEIISTYFDNTKKLDSIIPASLL